MNSNLETVILGKRVRLSPRQKAGLKGFTIGEKIAYRFFDGEYQGVSLLFVKPKGDNPTPRECDITGRRLSGITGLPAVFILHPGPTYERQRLMDKGVYFIMSERYAYLPMVVALEKTANRKKATVLTPVAQFLLLYHLEVGSIEGLSASEIAPLVPYSYASVTLGITCLTDLGLCKKLQQGQRNKVVHFELKGSDLWKQARPYLQSPVVKLVYCDRLNGTEAPICGINALAHYTMLNSESEQTVMMTKDEYNQAKKADLIENENNYDGQVAIEIWKYPVVSKNHPQWVDKLSLAISLKDDDDPRVEKEVERLISEMTWMD